MYNTLVEKCFKECVQGFRSKDLDTTEERCVQNCCNKYMKGSARVGQRFGELSAEAEQQMQAMMGQQQAMMAWNAHGMLGGYPVPSIAGVDPWAAAPQIQLAPAHYAYITLT